jgi:hypothetical protein
MKNVSQTNRIQWIMAQALKAAPDQQPCKMSHDFIISISVFAGWTKSHMAVKHHQTH